MCCAHALIRTSFFYFFPLLSFIFVKVNFRVHIYKLYTVYTTVYTNPFTHSTLWDMMMLLLLLLCRFLFSTQHLKLNLWTLVELTGSMSVCVCACEMRKWLNTFTFMGQIKKHIEWSVREKRTSKRSHKHYHTHKKRWITKKFYFFPFSLYFVFMKHVRCEYWSITRSLTHTHSRTQIYPLNWLLLAKTKQNITTPPNYGAIVTMLTMMMWFWKLCECAFHFLFLFFFVISVCFRSQSEKNNERICMVKSGSVHYKKVYNRAHTYCIYIYKCAWKLKVC